MNITPDNYELFFFQYAEGMLSDEERRQVEAFMQAHPDLQEEFSLYDSQLKLSPVAAPCPNKNELFRPVAGTKIFGTVGLWWRYAAAACVALLLVVGGITLSHRSATPSPTLVAENRPISAITTPATIIPDTLSTIATTATKNASLAATNSVGTTTSSLKSSRPSAPAIAETAIAHNEETSSLISYSSTLPSSTPTPLEQEKEQLFYTDNLITFVEPSQHPRSTPTANASLSPSTAPEPFNWQNYLIQQGLASLQRDTAVQEYLTEGLKKGRTLFAIWGQLHHLGEQLEPAYYAMVDNWGEKIEKYNIFR